MSLGMAAKIRDRHNPRFLPDRCEKRNTTTKMVSCDVRSPPRVVFTNFQNVANAVSAKAASSRRVNSVSAPRDGGDADTQAAGPPVAIESMVAARPQG